MIYEKQKSKVQKVENAIIDADENQSILKCCEPIIDADNYIDADEYQRLKNTSTSQCAPIIVASETCMPIIDAPDITVEEFVMRHLKA